MSDSSSVLPNAENTTAPNSKTVEDPSGMPEPRILTPEEVNQKWQEAIADIDRIIQYYKDTLIKMGVPDSVWLQNTLARHRAGITQQTGYELDVVSGHMKDTVNQANSYHVPDDMKLFFSSLADEFSAFCLDGTNPNYNDAPEWRNNCQRCVPAYEARRRGAQVTVHPSTTGSKHLAYFPFDAWINPNVLAGDGTGKETIEDFMSRWGNGARAQVVVLWNSPHGGGHTFIAEQKNGSTVYYDPQTGDKDVSRYFNRVRPDTTRFCRIDTLQMSGFQSECFEGKQI